MSLESRLVAVITAIGTDIKDIRTKQGDLTSLSTTAKSSLVAAINELYSAVGGAGAQIDDNAGDGDTLVTWSANKIHDMIEAAKDAVKDELVSGAAEALDTLSELADAINNDPSFAATVATALGNRVRFDAAQTLSAGEKLQACENIGVGNFDRNLANDYATAKA